MSLTKASLTTAFIDVISQSFSLLTLNHISSCFYLAKPIKSILCC